MCIILSGNLSGLAARELEACAEANPHGWGAAGPSGVAKGDCSPKGLAELAKRISAGACHVHFRYATHGARDEGNLHPFPVWSGEGGTLVVSHNGILSGYGDAVRSDTRAWVEDVLVPSVSFAGTAEQACDLVAGPLHAFIQEFAKEQRSKFCVHHLETSRMWLFNLDMFTADARGFWASTQAYRNPPRTAAVRLSRVQKEYLRGLADRRSSLLRYEREAVQSLLARKEFVPAGLSHQEYWMWRDAEDYAEELTGRFALTAGGGYNG